MNTTTIQHEGFPSIDIQLFQRSYGLMRQLVRDTCLGYDDEDLGDEVSRCDEVCSEFYCEEKRLSRREVELLFLAVCEAEGLSHHFQECV